MLFTEEKTEGSNLTKVLLPVTGEPKLCRLTAYVIEALCALDVQNTYASMLYLCFCLISIVCSCLTCLFTGQRPAGTSYRKFPML